MSEPGFRERWTVPPGRGLISITVGVAVLDLYAASLLSVVGWDTIPLSLLSLAVGGCWAIRLLIGLGLFVTDDVTRVVPSRRLLQWSLGPVVACATSIALVADGPFLLRVHLSKPALDALVARATGTGPLPESAQIGGFNAYAIRRRPGGVWFAVADTQGCDGVSGLVYAPDGRPDFAYSTACGRKLAGHWYVWRGRGPTEPPAVPARTR